MDITPRVLLSGGRLTGKTISVCHRIMRHLWDTPRARAAVFAKTIKVAKDGGIWEDIMDAVNEWIASGLYDTQTGASFEFTTKNSAGEPGAKIDSQTRTISFKIRNRFGGESELKLFSLEHDHEVEAKVKSTRFSLMWFSELSLYGDESVMNVSYLQLRMKHLKPWQHLWIADTNPHEDGEDHWIYKVWYQQRIQDERDLRAEMAKKRIPADKMDKLVHQKLEFRKSLKLIEIFLDDNTFLSEGQRVALMEQYDGDIGEYARNVDGKWVKGHGSIGKFFADIFSESIHVIGSDDPNVGDGIGISSTTFELIDGWDLGDVNHSWHALEKSLFEGQSIWNVLDEHVSIDSQVSISEYTLEVLEKMDAINRDYGRQFIHQHWSDSSSIDVWKSSGEGGSQAMEVEAASGGRIILEPVIKPKYSVKARVRLLRFLIRKQRLFVAFRCQRTIEMFWHLTRGTTKDEYVLSNRYKHPFDSLSYPIYMDTINDPDAAFLLNNKPKPRVSGIKHVDCLPGV